MCKENSFAMGTNYFIVPAGKKIPTRGWIYENSVDFRHIGKYSAGKFIWNMKVNDILIDDLIISENLEQYSAIEFFEMIMNSKHDSQYIDAGVVFR